MSSHVPYQGEGHGINPRGHGTSFHVPYQGEGHGRGHGMSSHVPLNGGKRAGDNPGGEESGRQGREGQK